MACTKHSPNDDMEFAVDAAKQEANRLLRRGRVWKYSLVQRIMDKPDPVARLIEELQDRGNVVIDIPREEPVQSLT